MNISQRATALKQSLIEPSSLSVLTDLREAFRVTFPEAANLGLSPATLLISRRKRAREAAYIRKTTAHSRRAMATFIHSRQPKD